jgi:hypothetical protein
MGEVPKRIVFPRARVVGVNETPFILDVRPFMSDRLRQVGTCSAFGEFSRNVGIIVTFSSYRCDDRMGTVACWDTRLVPISIYLCLWLKGDADVVVFAAIAPRFGCFSDFRVS